MLGPEITGEEKEIIIEPDNRIKERTFHEFENCEDYSGFKYTAEYIKEVVTQNDKVLSETKFKNPFKGKNQKAREEARELLNEKRKKYNKNHKNPLYY